jgi:uncharacterized membrane protein
MTLLVIEIHVPHLHDVTDQGLIEALADWLPISSASLSAFWSSRVSGPGITGCSA